jgi:hypothetical protein
LKLAGSYWVTKFLETVIDAFERARDAKFLTGIENPFGDYGLLSSPVASEYGQ